MHTTLFWIGLWLCHFQYLHAQTYQYKVLDIGTEQDTIMQLMWPTSTPSYFQQALCFEEDARFRLHDQQVNVPIEWVTAQTDKFNQHHQNVAVYYTSERSNLSNAVLHEFGFGQNHMIFNPHKDGFYLVLTENNGRKSSTLYELSKGSIIKHKSKTCNARIRAFPANVKPN